MTSPEKRARQKERRAAIIAAERAAWRRRRIFQTVAAVVVLGALIVVALFAGGGNSNGEGEEPRAGGGGPAACGTEAPPENEAQQYPEPEQVLQDGVDYGAVFTTSCGTITVDLFEEDAPETVNNFVFLAQEGFYDGLTFHRVEPNQVIQGGDPNGDGSGGPGYAIKDELPKSSDAYTFGTLAMANSGPNTSGSQFFFNATDPSGKQSSGYPPDYSLFGSIDLKDQESVQTIVEIAEYETEPQTTTPVDTIYIEKIEITEG